MPKWLHDKLAKLAVKKGLKGERKDAYIYGTLNKHEKKNKDNPKRFLSGEWTEERWNEYINKK